MERPSKKVKFSVQPFAFHDSAGNIELAEHSTEQFIDMLLRDRERILRERDECINRFDNYVRFMESSLINAVLSAENEISNSSDDDDNNSNNDDDSKQQQDNDGDDLNEPPQDVVEPVAEENKDLQNNNDNDDNNDDNNNDDNDDDDNNNNNNNNNDNNDDNDDNDDDNNNDDDDDNNNNDNNDDDDDDDDDYINNDNNDDDDDDNVKGSKVYEAVVRELRQLKELFYDRIGKVSTWGRHVPSALVPHFGVPEPSPFHAFEHMMGPDSLLLRQLQQPPPTADQLLDALASYMQSDQCRRIIVMSGAGVSVAAGIPDFRTPGTGLYSNLQRYDLPTPESVFDIQYFRQRPDAFYQLAKDLWPDQYRPTAVHRFVKRLADRGLLLRNYTQNIDTLEREAGVPDDRLVEAHGSFGRAECIDCRLEHEAEFVRRAVFAGHRPLCSRCQGLVKPCITFFGESLPDRFKQLFVSDFPQCDLLLVIGTSLQVDPFATLIHRAPRTTPRILINMEPAGENRPTCEMLGIEHGFSFNGPTKRDFFLPGDCQHTVRRLVQKLDWDPL